MSPYAQDSWSPRALLVLMLVLFSLPAGAQGEVAYELWLAEAPERRARLPELERIGTQAAVVIYTDLADLEFRTPRGALIQHRHAPEAGAHVLMLQPGAHFVTLRHPRFRNNRVRVVLDPGAVRTYAVEPRPVDEPSSHASVLSGGDASAGGTAQGPSPDEDAPGDTESPERASFLAEAIQSGDVERQHAENARIREQQRRLEEQRRRLEEQQRRAREREDRELRAIFDEWEREDREAERRAREEHEALFADQPATSSRSSGLGDLAQAIEHAGSVAIEQQRRQNQERLRQQRQAMEADRERRRRAEEWGQQQRQQHLEERRRMAQQEARRQQIEQERVRAQQREQERRRQERERQRRAQQQQREDHQARVQVDLGLGGTSGTPSTGSSETDGPGTTSETGRTLFSDARSEGDESDPSAPRASADGQDPDRCAGREDPVWPLNLTSGSRTHDSSGVVAGRGDTWHFDRLMATATMDGCGNGTVRYQIRLTRSSVQMDRQADILRTHGPIFIRSAGDVLSREIDGLMPNHRVRVVGGSQEARVDMEASERREEWFVPTAVYGTVIIQARWRGSQSR